MPNLTLSAGGLADVSVLSQINGAGFASAAINNTYKYAADHRGEGFAETHYPANRCGMGDQQRRYDEYAVLIDLGDSGQRRQPDGSVTRVPWNRY